MKYGFVPVLAGLLALGCTKEAPNPVASPKTSAPVAQKPFPSVQPTSEETSRATWHKWPDFRLDFGLPKAGLDLKESFSDDWIKGDPDQFFVRLEGVAIDGKPVGALIKDIGSGVHLYYVTLYVLDDDQWHVSYQLKGPASDPDAWISSAKVDGVTLVLSGGKTDGDPSRSMSTIYLYEKPIPLPSDARVVSKT